MPTDRMGHIRPERTFSDQRTRGFSLKTKGHDGASNYSVANNASAPDGDNRSSAPKNSTAQEGPGKRAGEQVILHPILIAIYPAVFLYAANKKIVDFTAILLPAAALACVAALLWLLARLATGNTKSAAMLVSLPMLAFFSYGATAQALTSSEESDAWPLVIAGCLGAACLAAAALLKWPSLLDPASYVLNIVSLVLVAAPLFQVAFWNYGAYVARGLLPEREAFQAERLVQTAAPDAPDIYYLILDGYGRKDVLQTDFDFDNSEFLSELEQRGFYIADQAVSNYPFTLASLTSTLNFDYLDQLVGNQLGASGDRRFLRELMEENRTSLLLQAAGYSIVSFSSEYTEGQIGYVDVDMTRWWYPGQYGQAMALMTPIPAVLDLLGQPGLYDLHRFRVEDPFARMHEAVAVKGPKFVYGHVMYGHPPFVFGKNGERISEAGDYTWNDGSRLLGDGKSQREKYVRGYTSQLSYLNGRLREAIDEILERSEHPPIIIIHGDHGPGSRYDTEDLANTDVRERFSILYAALLPEGGAQDLYPTISPVNGMRLLFNRYFGTDFPLVEDARVFSPFLLPYHFTRVDPAPTQGERAASSHAEQAIESQASRNP